MRVYVIVAHPSKESFTWEVCGAFTRGLHEAGHSIEVGDLYAMGFQTDLDHIQYTREMGHDPDAPVPSDVEREQEKIGRADGIAFIYPVWWSDCPAKLKGWFDRVLTYGYAYIRGDWGHRQKPAKVDRALILCPAGHTVEDLEQQGIAQAMRSVMLDDRIAGLGAKNAAMEILGGTTGDDGTIRRQHLERAYILGKTFASEKNPAGRARSNRATD
jgi:NAD(P)H dehydrogenase (quinone)